MRRTWPVLLLLLAAPLLWADGPQDNVPDKVRRIPPAGVQLPAEERSALEAGVAELGKEIDSLRGALKGKPALLELLPDVRVYHNAVRYALQYGEFFNVKEAATAKKLLQQGRDRAKALRDGKHPWTTATGLVVRGYVSKIDGSVQPYGLVVPTSYQPNSPHQFRLDVWCHGRGEMLSELNFVSQRQSSPGQFTPPNAFVLHPYGRYCNANKFAGEIDCFEALDHAKKHYPIDDNRIVMRGFSMGGAACWQFAVHYPDKWVAAAPGAGFAETAEFLNVFQNEKVQPPDYEKKLWHLYDCTDYAGNLFNCPTVAYSGEIDRQKQAADVMAKALKAEGIELVHIIGPKTGHAYEKNAKLEIDRRIDAIAARGRNPVPAEIKFTTWTLCYNKCFWVNVQGLGRHWERARVNAAVSGRDKVTVSTENVTALTLDMPPGGCPLDITHKPKLVIDGQTLDAPKPLSDRSWTVYLRKAGKGWEVASGPDTNVVRKRPGLQGPIDDAFFDRFLMVRPTGQPMNAKVGKWADAEMKHAIAHWRSQFRGEAPVKDDTAVNDADIANSNLILWGDPSSNQILAKIADKLPIRWTRDALLIDDRALDAGHLVPVFICPNPLNPSKYVVINSGFTYREYDYLNNARQVPKLPDWAIIDVDSPVTSRLPGKVGAAGFFNEQWQLPEGK